MSERRIVYGVRAVREALASGGVRRVLLAHGARSPELRALVEAVRAAGLRADERPRSELDALAAGGVHQGVVAELAPYRYAELDELVARAAPSGQPPLILVLDGVQDPRNLGAALRAAECLGAHGAVIPRDRAAAITPTVTKASAGATEHLPVAQVTNLARALGELKALGLWCVGTSLEAEQAPWDVDLAGPVALVIGGEHKGVRPLVLKSCDLAVKVPMPGRVGSLNAATAAGVLLYEALRQRSR